MSGRTALGRRYGLASLRTAGAVSAAVAVAMTAAVWVCADALAGGAKVENGEKIKKAVERLYDGEISGENAAERERVFVDVEKIMQKDKKSTALKAQDFWVEAMQEGRFANGKRKLGKTKEFDSFDVDVTGVDEKTTKAKVWYRAGFKVSGSKPCPLLVTIVEKGTDPKQYLKDTWAPNDNDEIAKDWVVAAIADGDEFPLTKDTSVIGYPFVQIRERFNTDANRTYMEGVGVACDGVQRAASQTIMANRLAGLVLRGPTKPFVTLNTALYPTVVVHSKTSKEGALVFESYKQIDLANNEEFIVEDVPSVIAPSTQVIDWFGRHGSRALPTSSTWITTITDTTGENWTGCLNIDIPQKRGTPTKVTTKYLREANTVDIQCDNMSECTLFMNDDLLDLDKEVAIFVNGVQNQKKRFERDLRKLFEIADTYSEWGRAFTAHARIVVPAKIVAPPAPPPAAPDPKAPGGGAAPVNPPAAPTQPTPPAPPK